MTRPKVSPDKRQRTAQACDSCKRRKQKCNGIQPCDTCLKRNLICTFSTAKPENGVDELIPPVKRRAVDQSSTTSQTASPAANVAFQHVSPAAPSPEHVVKAPPPPPPPQTLHLHEPSIERAAQSIGLLPNAYPQVDPQSLRDQPPQSSDLLSRGSKEGSAHDEEAVVYTSARMLQDPTGRLLYIGDSATLSYLQLIRMIVESIAGPSPFTMDPQRHRIVESAISLTKSAPQSHLLPEKEVALILVEAFYINTCGLGQFFDRKAFMTELDRCYKDPLHVSPSWLCLIYLTFAIGLVMATPLPGSKQEAVIGKLKSDTVDRAEVFFLNARNFSDPSSGFEDADFWSIQVLSLMTLYTLSVSKRNAAYAYFGMAIRSAFALGLHRIETLPIFSEEEQTVRRNLFRSLFVLDRFLSASLGRPTAISENDCSSEILNPDDHKPANTSFQQSQTEDRSCLVGLDASVRSCQAIGIILKKVYSKRKISTKLAQELADLCKVWPKALDPSLHWRQVTPTSPINPSQGIAILHVNLMYCHTLILLTRPFFLFILNKVQQERTGVHHHRSHRYGSRMEKFSEACVISACQSIILVQNAWEGRYLSRRDPFVTYWLFAASLIVLSNEFSKLYETPMAEKCVASSISIMTWCAETDPLAQRLTFILTSFRDVVSRQQESTRSRRIAMTLDDPIIGLTGGSPNESAPEKYNIPKSHNINRGPPASGLPPTSNGPAVPPIPLPRQTSNPSSIAHSLTRSPEAGVRHASIDGGDSIGEGEIDFDAFWTLPQAGYTHRPGPAPQGSYNPNNPQGLASSMVPLFGMAEFGRH